MKIDITGMTLDELAGLATLQKNKGRDCFIERSENRVYLNCPLVDKV